MAVTKEERGTGELRLVATETSEKAFCVASATGNTDANFHVTGGGFFYVGGSGTAPTSRTTFTQTYSTADATLGAYTADSEGTAYTATTDASGVAASVTDLNALRTAYQTLREHAEDTSAFVNKLVDILQSYGLIA